MANFQDGDITPEVADGLLRSTRAYEPVSVTIDGTAADSGNTPTTTLRKGLVLSKVTATDKYKQFDDGAADGTQLEAEAVVLAYDVDLAAGEDVIAQVYYSATLDEDLIILNGATFVEANCQRLRFR